MKILLLENIHESGVQVFKNADLGENVEIITCKHSLDEDALIAALDGISLLGIRSRTHITERVLNHAPQLQAIGAYCIGTNQIALEAAALRGIPAFNAPYSNTRSVAEMVIGEVIMLMRGLYHKISRLHAGEWVKSSKGSHEVRGKTLGIIGFGNIGSQVSVLAEGLGMRVCYYDIVDKLSIGNAVKMSSMEDVLRAADILTIHVDGNPDNTNLIDDPEFHVMKDGVYLINLSRGHVVNLDALHKHLLSGKVAGAALDVFPHEPAANEHTFSSPFMGMPNVLLTPHIGGSTEEAQYNIGEFVSGKLVEYMNTGSTFASVNFPRIQLPSVKDTHRLLHIHRNVPGVLSQLNTIFAQNSVNVLSQYLGTNQHIGYVIADVDKEYSDSLLHDLQNVTNTIRVRILY
ncbi:MAG: phosphoglycerate dehydrogenase [Bacteroidota bacterium]|nr:phosphoglycerate dehydrogenase [Candidatus Kapabacteria bacterium]MDW8220809.1 phosphoglycerate dehydrogenase [Bacteroidota bacterium]